MKICEEFVSIQGEGRYSGKPSYFVRLYGCNLRCKYCDSKFSYEADYYELKPEELAYKINKSNVSNLVITGGEPLLQYKEIETLLENLFSEITVEIETNGTINEFDSANVFNDVCYNISPKLQFENEIFLPRIFYHEYCVKFVDEGTVECREKILKFIKKHELIKENIYIMPEGKTNEEINQKALSTVEFCIENNFNYCHRVHVSLWNGKKGV